MLSVTGGFSVRSPSGGMIILTQSSRHNLNQEPLTMDYIRS